MTEVYFIFVQGQGICVPSRHLGSGCEKCNINEQYMSSVQFTCLIKVTWMNSPCAVKLTVDWLLNEISIFKLWYLWTILFDNLKSNGVCTHAAHMYCKMDMQICGMQCTFSMDRIVMWQLKLLIYFSFTVRIMMCNSHYLFISVARTELWCAPHISYLLVFQCKDKKRWIKNINI